MDWLLEVSGGGHDRLTQGEASIIGRDLSVSQRIQAPASEALAESLQDQAVLEDPSRQGDLGNPLLLHDPGGQPGQSLAEAQVEAGGDLVAPPARPQVIEQRRP
jgi:hypothetical protein